MEQSSVSPPFPEIQGGRELRQLRPVSNLLLGHKLRFGQTFLLQQDYMTNGRRERPSPWLSSPWFSNIQLAN
jgi:hypothetical protein